MRKVLSILLCLAMVGSVACAEVGQNVIQGGEVRNITIEKAPVHEPIEGESPVTGRLFSEILESENHPDFAGQAVTGSYMPMLFALDNADGGVGYDAEGKATNARRPWGAQYADVYYEAAINRNGRTNLTLLFSDVIPNIAGPCTSAYLADVLLREEWDSGIMFYGQPLTSSVNLASEWKKYGADQKDVLFDGTSGKARMVWGGLSGRLQDMVKGAPALRTPHDRNANLAALSTFIPADFEAANHTWLFTDDLPERGDDAEDIYIGWGKGNAGVYNSLLEWDEEDACYYRFMQGEYEYSFLDLAHEGDYPIPFHNVIVQFIDAEWDGASTPIPTLLGTGNADYFMGGKHLAGVWNRDEVTDRTVFYDEEGKEIELQRGRTLIILMDYQYAEDGRSVSYE